MNKTQSTVEILLQIRDDLRGLTAANKGFTQLQSNMGATARTAKQTTSTIDRDFGKLSASIKQKFSAKDVGMSLLQGMGIGSAFGVFHTALGKITEAYEAHQAALKKIDDTWAGIIEKSKAYRFDQLSPVEKRADLQGQLAELIRQRDAAMQPKTMRGNIAGAFGVEFEGTPTWGSTAERQAMADFTVKIADLAMEIEKLDKVIGPAADPAKSNPFGLANASAAINAEALNEQLVELQNNNRDLLDIARDAKNSVPFYFNPAEIKAAAIENDRMTKIALQHLKVWRDLGAVIQDGGQKQAILNNAKDAAEAAARAADQMGWAFTSAFEEAILSGKKLSEVLRGLARDIAQIALRQAVTEPLGNAVGGWISKIFAAGGGTFMTNGPTQLTVGDNPGGAELVSVLPISGVGQTRVSGSAVQMAGGGALLAGAGRGGDTFQFSYSFGSGVSRGEILALLPDLVEASKRGVLDAQRRRRDGFR